MGTVKGQDRKRNILENYYALLAREGLEGASINRLANLMGISPSLIVHYFPNKEELVAALVENILETYEKAFLPAARGILDPEKKPEAAADIPFGEACLGSIDKGVFYACYSLSFRNRRVRDGFRRMYSRLREILAQELGELMASGHIAESDPALAAELVIALLEGRDFYRSVVEDDRRLEKYEKFLGEKVMEMLRPRNPAG